MDPLTQTIGLLRPRSLLWKQLEARGDWAFAFPPNDGVVFSLVAEGECLFQAEGHQSRRLSKGDFVLLSAPPPWSLSSGPDVTPVLMPPGHIPPRRTAVGADRAGPVTRTLGGHFSFDAANAAILGDLLPPLVAIGHDAAEAGRLRAMLGLIGDEALADRPGRGLVVDRLLEVLLIEVIRHVATERTEPAQGLLAGLAEPPLAAALKAMHAEVARPWSVEQLAEVAGLSRSVFAERFRRVVGLAPIDYLLRWRMTLARDALRFGDRRLAQVAETCGYQSVSAFSTAFRRTVGCSPAKYAAR